jgi:hypothetical protein
MSATTLKPIRLECYLSGLSGANKVCLFRADSLARYLLQCAWDSSVVVMFKTHVGLNVATHSCNVYPDTCWFVVLCRFWLQCSCTLRQPCLYGDQSLSTPKYLHISLLTLGVNFGVVWFPTDSFRISRPKYQLNFSHQLTETKNSNSLSVFMNTSSTTTVITNHARHMYITRRFSSVCSNAH